MIFNITFIIIIIICTLHYIYLNNDRIQKIVQKQGQIFYYTYIGLKWLDIVFIICSLILIYINYKK